MDMRTWKKVLLYWINECNYVGNKHSNIEQSDIEGFFNTYIQNLKSEDSPTPKKESLISFLKSSYPDFTPLSDDCGVIHVSDYVYVYSLLLHYSCVQNPVARFHNICQKLSDHSQRCIASFFNEVLECAALTREVLRQSFVNITAVHVHSTPENRSSHNTDASTSIQINGSNSLGDLSLSTVSSQTSVDEVHSKSSVMTYISPPTNSMARLDPSITGTPVRQMGGGQRISPTTPRTVMLESRTRELFNLRAQLETERYEKGMMELQIKQNEEKISALTGDKKMLQVQLKELNQRSLACRFCDNDVSNSNNEADQIQKRLKKEINQKENAISILNENLRDITEEKSVLEGKLKYSEKQIDSCMKRIQELDNKVDDLCAELDKKNVAIQYLNNNKLELEQYINETRQALQSKRADLNCSSDCLESSFSLSSSNSSPENLGFVVDKQLREKEHENQKLLEELKNVSDSKLHLAQKLNEIVKKHAHLYHLEIECGKQNENNAEEQLLLISQCMELLGSSYNREYTNVKELQEQTNKLTLANTELNEKIATMEIKMEKLQTDLDKVTMLNEQITSEKLNTEEMMKMAKESVNRLTMENSKLTSELQVLQEELTKSANQYKQLQTDNDQLRSEADINNAKILDLQKKLDTNVTEHMTELTTLQTQLEKVNLELEELLAIEKALKDKNEKLFIKCEEHKERTRQTDMHLVDMRVELADKEQQMGQLGAKIHEFNTKNIELEVRYNSLMNKHTAELQEAKDQLTEKLRYIEKLERENREVLVAHKHIWSKYQQCRGQLMHQGCSVENIMKLLDTNDFDDALKQINVLSSFKKQAEEQIEILQQSNNAKEKEIVDLKHDLNWSQTRTTEAEEKLENLKRRHNEFIEQLKKDLKSKEIELRDQFEKSHDEKTERYDKELAEERANSNCLQLKLKNAVDSLNVLTDQLKMIQTTLENKEKELLDVNSNYESNITRFSNQIKKIVYQYLEAETITDAADDINKNNTITQDETKTQDQQLITIEQLIQKSLQQQVELVDHLKTEVQNQKDLIYRNQLDYNGQIEKTNNLILELEEKLATHKTKYADIVSQTDDFAHKLEQVQNEKKELIEKLARSSETLSEIIENKTAECEMLRKRSMDAEENVKQHQTDLQSTRNELTNLMEKLTLAMEELKANDVATIQVVATLNNIFNKCAAGEGDQCTVKNLFNVADTSNKSFDQLRRKLNLLVHNTNELEERLVKTETLYNDAIGKIEMLTQTNHQFEMLIAHYKINIQELQEKLSNEMTINTNKLSDLNETIKNIEDANEKLSTENKKLQGTLDSVSEKHEEANKKINAYETEIADIKKMNIEMRTEINNFVESESKLELSKQRMCLDLFNLQESYDKLQNEYSQQSEKLNTLTLESSQYETTLKDYQNLQQEMRTRQMSLENAQQTIESKSLLLETKEIALSKLRNTHESLQQSVEQLEKRNDELFGQINELKGTLSNAEDTVSELQAKIKEVRNECTVLQERCEEAEFRNNQLLLDVDKMRSDNQDLNEQLRNKDANIRHAEENIKKLRLDIDSISFERNASKSEVELLRAQMAANDNCEALSNTKLKELNEKSQEYERKLLSSENELKATKSQQDKLENEIEYLQGEVNKQREINESLTKRLERTSINLGEAQAKIMKLQRDNAQHVSKIELNSTTVTALQRERDSLQAKVKTLDERLSKSERSSELLTARVVTSEHAIRTLNSQREDAENLVVEYKARNMRLERSRECQDEKVRQLSATIDDVENKIVKLTLEIGGLNSQLAEGKAQLNERNEQLKSVNLKYDSVQQNLMNTNEKLSKAQAEISTLRREKNHLETKLHDATHKLSMHNIQAERCSDEIKQMRTEKDGIDALCEKLRHTNLQLEDANKRLNNEQIALKERNVEELQKVQLELETSMKLSKKLEIEIEDLQSQINDYEEELKDKQFMIDVLEKDLAEKKNTIGVHQAEMMKLQTQIKDYKHDLNEKQIIIESLQAELVQNKATIEYYSTDLKDMCQANKNNVAEYVEQVNRLQNQLQDNENELIKLRNVQSKSATNEIADTTDDESGDVLRTIIAQLRLDNQVLQAKYRDAKERIAEEAKLGEERVKEQRLELEGKLEKMKTKMKVLYTEEITKMKAKQEREVTLVKEQNDQLQVQMKKYEEHTRKLSSQIVRLNDKLLEYQKQNTMLSTKLKHVEESQETMSLPSIHYKRLSCMHAATTTAPQAVNLGTNLAMEDEEGEVFNNTYLTDLKAGRMPEITTEELQYRNSLLPPHLKSAYAAQYDLDAHEDDIKDGPHSLDDSMSALLSTTNCPARKKSCGTHYKRPGPPTPSKHGGRLSFGGSTEPPREILKESYDGGNAQSSGASSVKTPARFSFFSSRFSMGSNNGVGTGGCSGGGGGQTTASTGQQNQQRDERRKRNNNLLRRVHRRNMPALQRVIAEAPGSDDNIPFCTSTPRKSRTYYDQRRLINYCETSSATTPSEDCAVNYISNFNNTNSTTPLTIPGVGFDDVPSLCRRHSKSRSQTRVSITHRRCLLQSSSKKYSPQVHRLRYEICSSATTSSGGNDDAVDNQEQQQQQSYRRRRRQTRTGRPTRPSLYIHGSIFVKPRRAVNRQQLQQQHGAQRERFRAKKRNQRFDNFDQFRHLTSIEDSVNDCIDAFDAFKIEPDEAVDLYETVEEVEELAVKNNVVLLNNDTYNLKNNNSTFDNLNKWRNNAGKLNRFGTTMVIVKHEKPILPPDFLLIDNTEATALTAATFDVCDDDVVLSDNSPLFKRRVWTEQQHGSTVDASANVKQFEQMMCKADNSWLLASAQFSQRRRNQNNETVAEDYSNIKPEFEQMCKETVSNAPFSIKPLRYDNNNDDNDDSDDNNDDEYEEHGVDYLKSKNIDNQQAGDHDADSDDGTSIAVSCFSDTDAVIRETNNNCNRTTLLSSCCSRENSSSAIQKNDNNNITNVSVSSSHPSHTVYPPHNLFDRRLPIINVTHVPSRTSLVYVKKKTATTTMAMTDQQPIGGEGGGSATTTTTTTTYLQDTSNQRITATDFISMWHQMDNTARFIVCFAVFATLALCCNIGGIFYGHAKKF